MMFTMTVTLGNASVGGGYQVVDIRKIAPFGLLACLLEDVY